MSAANNVDTVCASTTIMLEGEGMKRVNSLSPMLLLEVQMTPIIMSLFLSVIPV